MVTTKGRKCDAQIGTVNTEWRICGKCAVTSKTVRIGLSYVVMDYCEKHKNRDPEKD